MNCPSKNNFKLVVFCFILIALGRLGVAPKSFASDTTPPTIINVTSDTTNGSYVAGNRIFLTIVFSEPVWITTGAVWLHIYVGPTNNYAIYYSGYGTNSITFKYDVVNGNRSYDLDYYSTNSLELRGDVIKDASGNTANLTLPTPGTPGSLSFNKKIVVGYSDPLLNITAPQTGSHVTSGNIITFTDSALVNPKCSINAADWAACVSGVTNFSNLPGFNSLNAGPFSLYLTETDSFNRTVIDTETGIIKDISTPAVPPTLTSVHIDSSNANTTWAKAGDNLNLTLVSDRNISAPTIIIAGHSAQVTGLNAAWSGAYQLSANDPEGVVAFSVSFADTGGIPGTAVTATTDGTNVTYDKTNPQPPGRPSASLNPTNSTTQTWNWTVGYDSLSGLWKYIWRTTQPGSTNEGNVLSTTTNFNDGLWSLFVKAVDNAGNESPETEGSVTVDTTGPVLTSVHIGSENSVATLAKAGDTVNLAFASSQTIQQPSVTISGHSASTLNTSGNSWLASYAMTANEPEGKVVFTIDYKDLAGNEGIRSTDSTDSSSVTFDKTPPTGSITQPSANSSVSGTRAINAAAEDNTGTGVTKVEFYFDSVNSKIGQDTTSPYSVDWNTTAAADGAHNLYLKIFDAAGNESGLVGATSVMVDNRSFLDALPPETIESGTDANWHNGNVTVTFPCTDSGSGCANTYYTTDGSTPTTGSNYGGSVTFTLDGTYTIKYFSTDNAGNSEAVRTAIHPVKIDKTPPGTFIATSHGHVLRQWVNDNTIEISWAGATDSGSGVAGYSYTWDLLESYTPDTVSEGTQTSAISAPRGDGNAHYFHLRAGDAAGNWSPALNFGPFYIDTNVPAKPTVNLSGGSYIGSQSLFFESSDAGSGIDGIYYSVDGSDPAKTSSFFSPGLPVTVDKDTSFKIVAYDKAGNKSEVGKEDYGIAPQLSSEMHTSNSATSATITWATDKPSTSRVVYDTFPHTIPGIAPNYGYVNSTNESETSPKVTSHSVTITGLSAGTTYYYRVVSKGSPENVGGEKTFKTTVQQVLGTTATPKANPTRKVTAQIPVKAKIISPVATGEVKGASTTVAAPVDSPTAGVLKPKERGFSFSAALLIPAVFSFLLVTYYVLAPKSFALTRKR